MFVKLYKNIMRVRSLGTGLSFSDIKQRLDYEPLVML